MTSTKRGIDLSVTLLLLGALSACAAARRDHYPEEWAAEEQVVAEKASATAPAEEEAPPSAEALANEHRTPNQCVTAARWMIDSEPKQALAYLEACSERPDFDVLQPLLRTPWVEFLGKAGPTGYQVLLRAIAARQDYEADFGSVHVSGLPVTKMGIENAAPGRLTPVFAANVDSAPNEVQELARVELKYHLRPGKWTETKYRVYANGRKEVLGKRDFTVERPSEDLPASYEPTGMSLRFPQSPRCTGPDSVSKVYFVQLGQRLQGSGADKDVYAAKVIACRGVGR